MQVSLWPAGWSRPRRSLATIVAATLALLATLWVAARLIALAPAPIGPNARFFADGMVVTMQLTVVASLAGVLLGLLAALGKTVFLFIPVYNVDGCTNRQSTSRVNQLGPETFGFRANGRNLDLNRDFVKCDSLSAQAFNRFFTDLLQNFI